MAHLFNSGRRCVPSFGSLALASVRHAPAIYRKNVALTDRLKLGMGSDRLKPVLLGEKGDAAHFNK